MSDKGFAERERARERGKGRFCVCLCVCVCVWGLSLRRIERLLFGGEVHSVWREREREGEREVDREREGVRERDCMLVLV